MSKNHVGTENQRLIRLLLAFFLAFGWVALVLRGGWSLGFFLAVLLTEIIFVIWLQPFAVSDIDHGHNRPLQIFLALVIVLLSLCMLLFNNVVLKILNVLVLLCLIPLQYLVAAGVFKQEWDQFRFWLEAALSFFLRPFIGLPGMVDYLRGLFGKKDASAKPGMTMRHIFGRILLGLLLAIPVLLLSGSLLAAADPIFAQWSDHLRSHVSLGEFLQRLLLSLLLFPFIFSFLYSGLTKQSVLASVDLMPSTSSSERKDFRLDAIVLISFLTVINLLYLAFAIIQITYLTGAFQAVLPNGLTYAEYARSGFFELAGISIINFLLILVAVKGNKRGGIAAMILRVESLLLILGSLVQWASAMFRMKMYIDVYGLSLLRFWVTAFMLLMLVFFILLLIKEFRPRLPFFKLGFTAALTALVILNFINCDAWIARHNADHYRQTGQIDVGFFDELSDSAVPVMLDLTRTDDSAVAQGMAGQLIRRYQEGTDRAVSSKWTQFNVSRAKARQLIAREYDRLHDLTDKTGSERPVP
ncbi:MAG: DUF4173 domain-containing protein [Saccharofermentanales bacterium]